MKHYHLETQRNKGTKTRSLFTVLCSLFMISAWLLSCGGSSEQEDENNVINNFKSTWNIYERFEMNDDGYIEYHALPWGGLVGDFLKNNLPMNLNGYEGITFEFAEPVPVPIQIVVAKNFKTVGKPGITSLTCSFDGQNVTSVDNIVLQASDTCDLVVKSVYLTPNYATWVSEPIWEGSCIFGDWTGSIEINGDKFNSAYEGDKIEFVCDYYSYDGDYLNTYMMSEQITYNGNLTVGYMDIGGAECDVCYCLTDIYGNEFWTDALTFSE